MASHDSVIAFVFCQAPVASQNPRTAITPRWWVGSGSLIRSPTVVAHSGESAGTRVADALPTTSTAQENALVPGTSLTGAQAFTSTCSSDSTPHASTALSVVPGAGGNPLGGSAKCKCSSPIPSSKPPWCPPMPSIGLHALGPSLSRHDKGAAAAGALVLVGGHAGSRQHTS